MARPSDNRPPARQIAAELRAEILSGEHPPGSQLPSTAQLMERFGVPNQTVQNAVSALKEEGLVEGQRGRGVFVRAGALQIIEPERYLTPAEPGQAYAWMTQAEGVGRRGSIDLLGVKRVPAPAEIARVYGVEPGVLLVCRRQLLRIDGEPVEYVRHYYNPEIADGTPLEVDRKIRGGTPTLLAELGYPPRTVLDTVSTRPPTSEEFVALDLPAEIPVLRTFRVILSDGDRPVEVSILIKAGHRHELRYRMVSPPTA